MFQTAMDHPEKLYPIILILVFILIVLYLQKIGEKKQGAGPGSYLGTQLHVASMSETIEDVARKVIIAHPTHEDSEQVRMIRDELLLRGFKNVDLYESAIYATVSRLKGGAAPPSQRGPAPPTM